MKIIFRVFSKFFIANFAVVLAILLLPVFLVTDHVALFDQIMDYLFSNSKG